MFPTAALDNCQLSASLEVSLLSEDRERKKSKNLTVEEAGHIGGQKVKKLIEEGKEHEEE